MKNMMQPVDKDNPIFKKIVEAFPHLFSDPQYAEMVNDIFFTETDADKESTLYFTAKLSHNESALKT